jgi:endoglucanase
MRTQPIIALATVVAMSLVIQVARAAPLPRLQGQGSTVVESESGKHVILRGCNLGNWLLLEAWMQKWDIEDQQTIARTLSDRFGQPKAQELMEAYRAGYIAPRDFELIKSFNFNVVRLPFESLLLMDEHGQMRPDAFKWLDRALEMAQSAGVYVILDMHGAPGRQSTDQCTGERGQNRLWSDASCQQRMTDLWTHIAQRYKDRTVVAAYDLLNEPYADFRTDVRSNLKALTARCYKAIRSTGDSHLIIFPNALGQGVTFYRDVRAKGMTQVAFTDHYYAGLFGSPSTVASHANVIGRTIPETAAYVDRIGSPMLIGEFNVVLEKCGGEAMMRRYYDEFASRGWMATMWSYKLLKPAGGVEGDNWYLVTNADALPAIDVRTSSLEQIEKYMSELATMPLAVDEKLHTALTEKVAPPMPLPDLDPLPQSVPSARSAGDWKLIDVETDIAAGVSESPGGLSIVSAGSDIFTSRDSFSFLQQNAPTNAMVTATLNDLLNSDVYAKAGLMIRFGTPGSAEYPSAPFAMIHAFPDGGLAFTVRDRAGGGATETKRIVGPLPRRLAMVRDHSRVDAYFHDGNAWIKAGSAEFNQAGPEAQIGVAVCSHHSGLLTRAQVRDLVLVQGSAFAGNIADRANPTGPRGRNLLRNPSFESPAAPTGFADEWNHWGDRIIRQDSPAAAHSSKFAITSSAGDGGAWQDVHVEAGKQYAFSLFSHHDGASPPKGQTILISLEASIEGKQVPLAERSYEIEQLESAGGWSLLQVSARAVSDELRVLVRLTPASGASQSVVSFDDASLIRVRD